MTKTTLLTATAFAALAFAGAANAQTISTAKVSNITVQSTTDNTTITPLTVASEVVATGTSAATNLSTTSTTGDNVVSFVPALALERGVSYRATYALSGAATPTFLAQLSAGSFSAATASSEVCLTGKQVVAGTGASGSNTVSVVFTVATETVNCTSAQLALLLTSGLQFDAPFGVTAAGTVTGTVSAGIDVSNTVVGANPAVFGASDSVTLARSSSAFVTRVSGTVDNAANSVGDNADFLTQLALGTTGEPFRSFVTTGGGTTYDQIIGGVGFAAATAPDGSANSVVYANYRATSLPAATFDLLVKASNGDFVTLRPFYSGSDGATSGTALTRATDNLSASATGLSGLTNVGLAINGTPTTSISVTPRTFTATVTPILVSNTTVTTPSAIIDGALETLGLQGSTFIAPWVQSSNANYNTVIRLSNSGGAVGATQLTISSPLATPTRTVCTAAELPKLASIAANGELAINSADLTTCFGAFGRGDVSITVLSLSANLTAKLRIVNPGNIVAEQSLGRFGSPVSY